MRCLSPTLIFAVFGLNAQAMVWRADLESAPQTDPRAEMRNVVRIHYTRVKFFGGCGIQLNENWVLTARHAAARWKPGQLELRRGDQRMAVKRIIPHPDAKVDLALLELSAPVALPEKLKLRDAAPKKGARLWLGGFGKNGPVGSAGKAGVFIAGHNLLTQIDGKRGKIILDPPGAASDPDEVLPTRFDSGSPVFIGGPEKWQLSGITVTASNSKNPSYGDRSHHQLLGPERAWLDAQVPGLVWTKP